MSRRYTLEECYTMLDVHPKTFRQWLKDDNITTKASKADKRIKFLTEEQVKQLAELHDKPWPPTVSQEAEVIPVTAYKLLIEQVEQLNAAQATLQAGITELRGQQGDSTLQFTAIGAAQQEQIQREQQEHEELLEQWQKANTAIQEMQSKITEDIATQVAQQGESLGQLGSRIDELQGTQKETLTSLQEQQAQGEKRLQAQFQSDLASLRQQMQEDFERQLQGIKQGLARDVAALATQLEQLSLGLERLNAHVTSIINVAEEAKAATPASQGRITGRERNGTNREQHDQAEKATHVDLAEHITQPETQAVQRTAPETPVPARRRTSSRKTTEADATT
jgi:DNA repair exonuclease SbcCD ATPase subunit